MADESNTGHGEIPASWRDPSGWRPTVLQYSVDPEARGESWDEWTRRQSLASPEQISIWLTLLDNDKKKPGKRKRHKKVMTAYDRRAGVD